MSLSTPSKPGPLVSIHVADSGDETISFARLGDWFYLNVLVP